MLVRCGGMQSVILERMKHSHEQCSEQIVLRMPSALRGEIERKASAEGRSLANMARRILERAVREEDEHAA
jgi:predicted DNA binding CopG/RHH family protein